MRHLILSLLTAFALSQTGWAAPLTFDFKDPKGVNNARFSLDAPLEAIAGSANGISGKVSFDPAQPASTRGKIVIETASLHVPNSMMKNHMLGEQWLNAEEHPQITFEVKKLSNLKVEGNITKAAVAGTFTCKGVSRDITVPIILTYLPDKLSLRVPNQKGDLLVIRANFSISRSEFGINPGAPKDKVADQIDLTLSIAGAAAR